MEAEARRAERRRRNQTFGEEADLDADMLESPRQRRRRYLDSSMDEVSEPDEWAEMHYGHLDQFNNERMVAFTQANQVRLRRAIDTLTWRRAQAEVAGDWDDAANYTRAIAQVEEEALRDIA